MSVDLVSRDSGRVAAASSLRRPSDSRAKIVLLGTGNVGRAVVARLKSWDGTPLAEGIELLRIANTRSVFRRSDTVGEWVETPASATTASDVVRALGTHGVRIAIDATACGDIAERHALWLAQGIHVVTACKLGQGGDLARWRAIRDAQRIGGTHYGDSATVGAGLPLLRTIRELRNGGDRIHAIVGVLSGSLAWLFDRYDGSQPFSMLTRQAREVGYTEPDPREDLSGEDVRRKILILARAAGIELECDEVAVESLVPPALASLPVSQVDAALDALDTPLSERFVAARARGEYLRFVARLEGGAAWVGLESLPADHPLVGGRGTDNRVAIMSDRYREQPVVIQGPGAGAEVTAAAVLDDAIAIVRGTKRSLGSSLWR